MDLCWSIRLTLSIYICCNRINEANMDIFQSTLNVINHLHIHEHKQILTTLSTDRRWTEQPYWHHILLAVNSSTSRPSFWEIVVINQLSLIWLRIFHFFCERSRSFEVDWIKHQWPENCQGVENYVRDVTDNMKDTRRSVNVYNNSFSQVHDSQGLKNALIIRIF